MARSTQNTNLASIMTSVQRKDKNYKLSAAQQKQWSAMVVARMTQAFKAKSINQVVWGEQKK